MVLVPLKRAWRKSYRYAKMRFQTILGDLLKIDQVLIISLSFPSKMTTIFCRKLIQIIWYHQDIACLCVHLTMALFLLKHAWIQSYRSSKIGLQDVLHHFMKRHVSTMNRYIGENVSMKEYYDENTQWFKDMMKKVFKQKFEVEERCLNNPNQCNIKRRHRPMKWRILSNRIEEKIQIREVGWC